MISRAKHKVGFYLSSGLGKTETWWTASIDPVSLFMYYSLGLEHPRPALLHAMYQDLAHSIDVQRIATRHASHPLIVHASDSSIIHLSYTQPHARQLVSPPLHLSSRLFSGAPAEERYEQMDIKYPDFRNRCLLFIFSSRYSLNISIFLSAYFPQKQLRRTTSMYAGWLILIALFLSSGSPCRLRQKADRTPVNGLDRSE